MYIYIYEALYVSAWLLKYFLQYRWMLRDRTDANWKYTKQYWIVIDKREKASSAKKSSYKVIITSYPIQDQLFLNKPVVLSSIPVSKSHLSSMVISNACIFRKSSRSVWVELTIPDFLWVPRLFYLTTVVHTALNYLLGKTVSWWRAKDFSVYPGLHGIHKR